MKSAVSKANVDGFQKFKIMVVRFDLKMENDEKQHYFLLFIMILKNSQGTFLPHSCALDKILSYLTLKIYLFSKVRYDNILSNTHERGKNSVK